jgi:hypothetical protein
MSVERDEFKVQSGASGLLNGNNRLMICHGSMKAILQDWVSREIASELTVEDVKYEHEFGGFTIAIKAPPVVK